MGFLPCDDNDNGLFNDEYMKIREIIYVVLMVFILFNGVLMVTHSGDEVGYFDWYVHNIAITCTYFSAGIGIGTGLAQGLKDLILPGDKND